MCFPTCMYVCYMSAGILIGQKRASEQGIGSPGTRVDGCKLPSGCWKLNLRPPQEQQVFLAKEPSLKYLTLYLKQDLFL